MGSYKTKNKLILSYFKKEEPGHSHKSKLSPRSLQCLASWTNAWSFGLQRAWVVPPLSSAIHCKCPWWSSHCLDISSMLGVIATEATHSPMTSLPLRVLSLTCSLWFLQTYSSHLTKVSIQGRLKLYQDWLPTWDVILTLLDHSFCVLTVRKHFP